MSQHILSLDLGQTSDPSALVVLERFERPQGGGHYDLTWAKRWPLGTRYPEIVADVVEISQRAGLNEPMLAVDQTGVGRPVVDLFVQALQCWMRPVTLTAGSNVSYQPDGMSVNVPKKDVVACLLELFGYERIRIAAKLSLANTITKELENFRVKVTKAANEVFGAWREGQHDDLVLALGIGCWVGENCCAVGIPESPPESRALMSRAPGADDSEPETERDIDGKLIVTGGMWNESGGIAWGGW